MEGVSVFENWFSSVPGASCSPEVSHCDFGNLRGLSIDSPSSSSSDSPENIMNIPKSIVLSSDFSQSNWDVELAQKLWLECAKGASSSFYGYVSLLTRGWTPADLPKLPPPTAPDALRHWTDEEKQLLSGSSEGERLLSLMEQQDRLWEEKFSKNIQGTASGMTFEQFRWAMEVVHSRAFCGDFGAGGSSPLPPIVSTAIPVAAAAAGALYFNGNPSPSDAILIGLALVGAAPTLLSFANQNRPVAVLLPMIDSINHLEEADSTIDYSPLSDTFTLTVGKKCVVEEEGQKQLFISYGKKKDTELLLNYGFLRGVSSDGDSTSRRKSLAEAFISR